MNIIAHLKRSWFWINHIKNSNKINFFTIITSVILIFSIIGIYVFYFWDRKIGNPSDFANFATYVGNLVMPILTIGSVIALLSTLKLQRDQLNDQRIHIEKQRNSDLFESYVKRFEMQYERFIELTNLRFPSFQGDGYQFHFNLAEYNLLNKSERKYKVAKSVIDSLPKFREIYKQPNDSKDDITDVIYRINVYVDQLFMEVNGLHHCLVTSYKFTYSDDAIICMDMHKRVVGIFFDLEKWNLITKEERNKLIAHIHPPPHLKEFELDTLLIS